MSKVLCLSKELYRYQSICCAVKDYRQLASIQIKDTPDYYECVFEECRYGVERTIDEFENYLIGMTVKEKTVW